MKPRKIIIVTEKFDLNADAIILRLRAMGQFPLRVNVEDLGNTTRFSLRWEQRKAIGWLRTENREVALADIRSVYWRPCARFEMDASSPESQFGREETEQAWRGLWSSLPCYWMNSPPRAREATGKIGQLERAIREGFDVPRTLITAEPAEAFAFCEQCGGRVVLKAMGRALLREAKSEAAGPPTIQAVYPTLVPAEALRAHSEDIANASCLFQEYVEKKAELRVTVIGTEVFAARLESSRPMRSPADWQEGRGALAIQPTELPDDLRERCLSFVQGAGLQYNVVELAEKPDGGVVFLESNPGGQCFLVEEKAPALKMIDAVAACLIRGEGWSAAQPS